MVVVVVSLVTIEEAKTSKLVFYALSTITVISGRAKNELVQNKYGWVLWPTMINGKVSGYRVLRVCVIHANSRLRNDRIL